MNKKSAAWRLVLSAAVLALILLSAGNPIAAEKEGQTANVSATVQKVWNDLYASKFSENTPGCEFDYGPNGMRNIYCYASSIFSYGQLAELSKMSPFVKGPHTESALRLDSQDDFGHYNPEFVKWLIENLIPGAEDENFRWISEPVYKQFLQKTARVYFLTMQKLSSDTEYYENEVSWYLGALEAGELDPYWPYRYGSYLPDSVYDRYLDSDFYYGNVVGCAVGFWIRRKIDGTADLFYQGLYKLLKTYDPEFIKEVGASQPAAQMVQKTGDPILDRFLRDLTQAVETHDWDLVLTFFEPGNYLAQKEIGIGRIQYIEEGLGLGMVSTKLKPRPGDSSEAARLNAIETITIDGVDQPADSEVFVVRMTINLFDGSKRQVELTLIKSPTGAYFIEPAVG